MSGTVVGIGDKAWNKTDFCSREVNLHFNGKRQ